MAKFNKKRQLNYPALLRELREKGPERLYLLYGPEDYLLSDFVKRLRNAAVAEGNEDFDAKKIPAAAPAAEDVEDALNAMPFSGGGTFLELSDFDVNKYRDERLGKLLSDIPEWCTVAIVLPAGAEPDGRLSLVKTIKKFGRDICFTAQSQGMLYSWLERRFRAGGKRIDRAAMDRLLFISGSLMNRLIPEIDKICGYAAGDTVTVQDVEAVAVPIPEAVTFEFTDALSRRDFDTAARLLSELLAQNLEPIEILGGVGWQMRRLYGARLCRDNGCPPAHVGDVFGIRNDYALRMLMESAGRFSLKTLTASVRLCAETDYRIKSSGGDPGDILREMLIRLGKECRDA